MGRIVKILLSLVLSLFLLPSWSFSFKVISHNLVYALYKKEKLVWSFKIKEFIQKENGDFKGKEVYIINKQKGFEIWAKNGIYKKAKNKFLFKNNVRLITSKYGEVLTQELIFYPKKNLIFTDKEVIVIKKGLKIKGVGLIYNIETGNFQVKEKAKVKLKL